MLCLPTLFNVVNNTEQIVEPESSLQSSVTMLNNIVDNIVQILFLTTRNFLPCND